MEVLVAVHSDSTVNEYDVSSGQLLRVTDPQTHAGVTGHKFTSTESLVDNVGGSSVVIQNKSSLKLALWSGAEISKAKQSSIAADVSRLNSLVHSGCLSTSGAQITSISVSPCRNWIVRGTSHGHVVVSIVGSQNAPVSATGKNTRWRSRRAALEKDLDMHIGAVTALSSNSIGWVASGGQDCSINVFCVNSDFASNFVLQSAKFQDHSLPITSLHLSDSLRLFSASKDQSCKVWDVASRSLLASISFPSALTSIAVSPLQESIFCGALNGVVYRADLWRLAHHQIISSSSNGSENTQPKRQPLAVFKAADQGSASNVTSISVSVDGSKIAVGYSSGACVVWDSSSCQKLYSIQHSKSALIHLQFQLNPTEVAPFNPLSKDLDQPGKVLQQLPPSHLLVAPTFVSPTRSPNVRSSTDQPSSQPELDQLRKANAELRKLNHDLLLQVSHSL